MFTLTYAIDPSARAENHWEELINKFQDKIIIKILLSAKKKEKKTNEDLKK